MMFSTKKKCPMSIPKILWPVKVIIPFVFFFFTFKITHMCLCKCIAKKKFNSIDIWMFSKKKSASQIEYACEINSICFNNSYKWNIYYYYMFRIHTRAELYILIHTKLHNLFELTFTYKCDTFECLSVNKSFSPKFTQYSFFWFLFLVDRIAFFLFCFGFRNEKES